jgi:hypothetical protein
MIKNTPMESSGQSIWDSILRFLETVEESALIYSANVPDEESPLASGVAPASAGDMTEVPKGRGFAPSVCSAYFSFEGLPPRETLSKNVIHATKWAVISRGFINKIGFRNSVFHDPLRQTLKNILLVFSHVDWANATRHMPILMCVESAWIPGEVDLKQIGGSALFILDLLASGWNANGVVVARHIISPNVPDHLLPLALGADPASAGSVTKVPKAW